MNLQEDYCSYEVSRLLEEKGFPFIEHLFMYVDKSGRFMTVHQACLTLSVEEYCKHFDELFTPTITHQMAMKWLREVHKISVEITSTGYLIDNDAEWECDIKAGHRLYFKHITNEKSFESCAEAAIKYCLEHLI